jgi:hypothetical protein
MVFPKFFFVRCSVIGMNAVVKTGDSTTDWRRIHTDQMVKRITFP